MLDVPAVHEVATGGGVKRSFFIASAAAVAVAPLVPLPAKAAPDFTIGTLDLGAFGTGLAPSPMFISDEMLRQIERHILNMKNFVQAKASRSATPGVIDISVVEMAQPKFDITFTADGNIKIGGA